MAKYAEFKIEDLKRVIESDDEAKAYSHFFSEASLTRLANIPNIFAIEVEGEVVCMGGVAELWPQRGEGWIFYDSEKCKKNFVGVFRLTKKWIEGVELERIEAAAKCDSKFAAKHLMLLGFRLEAPRMKKYYPNGDDYSLYARVK